MSGNSENALPKISLWKLLLPLLIGISVTAYLVFHNFKPNELREVEVSGKLIAGLLLATLTVIVRDGGFIYKYRLSTGNTVSWRKAFQTIMLWEFSACITPKVAEAPFVVFLLKKSGLSYGKSVAVLFLNTFLDNLVFVLVFAVLYFILGNSMLTYTYQCPDLEGHQIMQAVRDIASKAWIGYLLFVFACVFLGGSLFLMPHFVKRFCHRIAVLPVFSSFKSGLIALGDDIEITADEFKNMPFSFWIKMFVSTFFNWFARFFLACALLLAFSTNGLNIIEVLSRQYVLWIFTTIPSTPGASGVAEISFMALNCEFMPLGLAAAIVLLWRIFSYYLYLLIGLLLLPRWSKQIAAD